MAFMVVGVRWVERESFRDQSLMQNPARPIIRLPANGGASLVPQDNTSHEILTLDPPYLAERHVEKGEVSRGEAISLVPGRIMKKSCHGGDALISSMKRATKLSLHRKAGDTISVAQQAIGHQVAK